jgi:hypothetical protein
MDPVIKIAYILGCKMARMDNANQLASTLDSLGKEVAAPGKQSIGEASDLMRNFDEKNESEAAAPYGSKHQLAQNPEWAGP